MSTTAVVKHTPGPWDVRILDKTAIQVGHGGHLSDEIALIENKTGAQRRANWTREQKANAYLIAAAPELLEALKAMDDLLERLWESVPWGKTFDLPVKELNEVPLQAKAAIAKAEGKS